MRPLRYLILLLVLATALFVALARPLAGEASYAMPTPIKKLQRKFTHRTGRTVHRRRHHRSADARQRIFGRRVAKYSRRFLGVPYVYGGSTPSSGFDCSGFVAYVYKHFGIPLPHSSYGDLSHGRKVRRKFLRPGDILFFSHGGHVGIYLSGNRVIDAPHTGSVVHISTMSDWYSSEYYTARRFKHAG
jgi:cell wall-associated NlpC family hydrolase